MQNTIIMYTRPCLVLWLFAFDSLAFFSEGRIIDPTTLPGQGSSDPSPSGCELPPFLPPFVLSDVEAFDAISSCPFLIHQKITGKEFGGCFPMYNIPHWGDSNSGSFEIYEFNAERETPLIFEKKSEVVGWEDLTIVSTLSESSLGECIANLNYKVEGINGEISGGNGTASLSAIVVSFKDYGEENHILLPVGGCEGQSRQSGRRTELLVKNSGDQGGRRAFEESCSIRPNSIASNQCLEKCHLSIESNYIDEIDKLAANRDRRISKNLDNKELVFGKLLITRITQLGTAFARCKCKHVEQDIGQCFLQNFLDTVVEENEHQFEVEETFDRHMEEVETWFENNRKLICDASTGAALRCRPKC